MRIYHYIIASLCILIAFCLPISVARPHEISRVSVSQIRPVASISAPQFASEPEATTIYIAPPVVVPVMSQAVTGTNSSMDYIFQRESGGRLDAVNPIGACGIGQSLPCSKLSNACPNWTTDADCQIRFFTNYAITNYGSWDGAANAWKSKGWW